MRFDCPEGEVVKGIGSTTQLFRPHPNLSDEVNHNIVQSEVEGGVHLDDLAQGSRLEVQTQHRWYTVVNCGDGWVLKKSGQEQSSFPPSFSLAGPDLQRTP